MGKCWVNYVQLTSLNKQTNRWWMRSQTYWSHNNGRVITRSFKHYEAGMDWKYRSEKDTIRRTSSRLGWNVRNAEDACSFGSILFCWILNSMYSFANSALVSNHDIYFSNLPGPSNKNICKKKVKCEARRHHPRSETPFFSWNSFLSENSVEDLPPNEVDLVPEIDLGDVEGRMQRTLDWLSGEYAKMRLGRATPGPWENSLILCISFVYLSLEILFQIFWIPSRWIITDLQSRFAQFVQSASLTRKHLLSTYLRCSNVPEIHRATQSSPPEIPFSVSSVRCCREGTERNLKRGDGLWLPHRPVWCPQSPNPQVWFSLYKTSQNSQITNNSQIQ